MWPFKANHDYEIDTVDSCKYKFHFRVVSIHCNSIQMSLVVSHGSSPGKLIKWIHSLSVQRLVNWQKAFSAQRLVELVQNLSLQRLVESIFTVSTSATNFPREVPGVTTRDIWIELLWIDTTRKWNLYLQESAVSISWSWFALNGDKQLYQLMIVIF